MKLARITGTVSGTLKDVGLTGLKLLVADVTDGTGKTTESGLVAADTVGAGVGDRVLIATGSAARLPQATAGAPVDAAVVAIVDQLTVSAK